MEQTEAINIQSSAKNYLYKMAYNQFPDSLRRNKKQASFLEQLKYEALQVITTPLKTVLEQKSQRLWRIIERLPERCQEVVRLKIGDLINSWYICKNRGISNECHSLKYSKIMRTIFFYFCSSSKPSIR